MMVIYFQLQCKRLIRTIRDLGINPYLGIALGAVVFVLLSNLLFNRTNYALYIYCTGAIMTAFQLSERKRNEFLKNIYSTGNYIRLRLVENLVVALPFVVFLMIKNFYLAAFITVSCISLCSSYNDAGRSNFSLPSPFSKRPFEFTTGFRKNYWMFILIYLVTTASLSVGNFNLGLLAYVAIFLVCMSFYATAEPLFYVWVHALQPKGFLKNKLSTAIRYSLFVSLPIAIVLMIFFPLKVPIILAAALCGLLYVTLGVIAKYTNYPNQINLLQTLMMSIGIVLPPVMLLLIPHFYLKSVKKLNPYLP